LKSVGKALLGRKLGMTQLFDKDGRMVPVTVIAAGPCVVVQRKTKEKEGHDAVQIGYEEVATSKRVPKPLAGHYRRAGEKAKADIAPCRHLVEVRLADCDSYQVGDRINVEIFEVGQRVDVTGTSKGKGFAGVQKRHGARGGPASHGSMSHRRPASGGATDPARVFKGTKKPGHMGNARVTVKRLHVHMVNSKENLLAVQGAVPGPNGGLVLVSCPHQAAANPAREGE